MIKSLLTYCFGFIFVLGELFAQQGGSVEFLEYFTKQFNGHPLDQIYIQTSKDIYETGEDLWFKAYQLDAQSMGLSGRCQTLYVQLITPHDSVAWQEKYPIINGVTEGHIYLDTNLPIGNYRIEAYSRYSCYKDSAGNVNDSLLMTSYRSIKVVEKIAQYVPKAEIIQDSTIRLVLFPEGGDLLHGVPACLAFKATNSKGMPASISGSLMEGECLVAKLESSHDGMGAIHFTPDANKQYHIALSDGSRHALPTIRQTGISLHLRKQNSEDLEFIICQPKGSNPQKIYLVGQMRGALTCMAQGLLRENLKVKIPTSEFLYQGIAEFTLYNEAMQPMAERLVYLHQGKQLQIETTLEKERYTTREKVTMKIKVTDEAGMPIQANLGVSIYDKAYQDITTPMNILSHCYLSSQIKGHIHNPTYYFNEENKDRKEHLDLLLLTQGWRRYIWSVNSEPQKGTPFLTDEIRGRQSIEKKKSQKATQGTAQLIQVSGAVDGAQFIYTDSLGNFTVTPDILYALRGGYVYLKPMLDKEHKPKLEMEELFPQLDSMQRKHICYTSQFDLSLIKIEQKFHSDVISADSSILLDEVVVTRKSRRPIRDKFMGRLDSLMQMELNPAWVCKCSPNYLNDYREGYTHHPHGYEYKKERLEPIIGKSYRIIKHEYVSGTLLVTETQTIEYEGILFSDEELLRMNNLWRTKGYYATREFYEADEADMQLSIPDNRNTLFWKPSVITNAQGEAEVSFYCSDLNTGFIGVIDGVDGVGLLGSKSCEFRVIKEVN